MDIVLTQFFTVMTYQDLITIVSLGICATLLYILFSYF